MNVLELTRELVGFNTVSTESNAEMAGRLVCLMESLGFATGIQSVTDALGVVKQNVIGLCAAHDGRTDGGLILSGHMDTVPFRPDQKATLSPVEEHGRLFGRGTCDMKGAIAAQVVAASRFAGRPLARPLRLVFTFDEEVGCLGAKALRDARLVNADCAIVGEPTGLTPIRMHKGYWVLRVTIVGRACHSSDPRRGVSAVKAAVRALAALERLEPELGRTGPRGTARGGPGGPVPGNGPPGFNAPRPSSGGAGEPAGIVSRAASGGCVDRDARSGFDPDGTTLNVGTLKAGVAHNVVPDRCVFTIDFRHPPGQAPVAIRERIEATVCAAVQESGVGVEVEQVLSELPFETAATAPIVRFMEEATGFTAGGVSYSTEAKEFASLGIATVIVGPGSIEKAHQEDEYVPVDELGRAVELYARAIERFSLLADPE